MAGAIAFVRWLRYRNSASVPADRLGDIYRANALTVGAVAAVAVAEVVTGVGASRLALVVGGGVLLAAASAVGLRVRSAMARAQVVPAAAPNEDALDDFIEVGRSYVPWLVNAAQGVPDWLDIRRRPWRFCLVFAAACGVGLALWHGVVEASGPLDPGNVARALLAGVAIASIEGLAVIACFAAFGRFLGIRR